PRCVVRRGNLDSVFFLCQPDSVRQSVVSNQQIHLDPFARALLIHQQSQRGKRTALHPHAQYRGLFCFVESRPGQRGKICRIISARNSRREITRRIVLPACCCASHQRILCGHSLFGGFQVSPLLPIPPAYPSHKNRSSSQSPCRHNGSTPHHKRAMPRAKLLPQPHLHARRCTSFEGFFTEGPQLFPRCLPGLL